ALGIPSGPFNSSGLLPGGFQVLPPSSERWMIWPNQPLDCDAKMRSGLAGDPFKWYISHPAKCGPLTSHLSRFPSELRMKAPLRVPTSNRTLLINLSFIPWPAKATNSRSFEGEHVADSICSVNSSFVRLFSRPFSPLILTTNEHTAKGHSHMEFFD